MQSTLVALELEVLIEPAQLVRLVDIREIMQNDQFRRLTAEVAVTSVNLGQISKI